MTISIKYTERFKKTIKALNDTSNILKSSIQMVSDTVIYFRNKYPDDINNSSSNVFKDELSKVIFSIRGYPLISALYYTEGTSLHTIFDQGLYSDCIKLISRIVEDSKWHNVFIKKWLNEAGGGSKSERSLISKLAEAGVLVLPKDKSHKTFQRKTRDFTADRIKARQDDRFRSIINDEIDAGQRFDGTDISAFTTNDASLHLFVRKSHDGNRGL